MDKLDKVVGDLEGKEWSILKLFVTDYWQNWEHKKGDVTILIAGGLLFACVAEVILRFCQRKFGWFRVEQLKKRSSMSSLGIQLEVERGLRHRGGQRVWWWRRIR
jgi:hypothetical protein